MPPPAIACRLESFFHVAFSRGTTKRRSKQRARDRCGGTRHTPINLFRTLSRRRAVTPAAATAAAALLSVSDSLFNSFTHSVTHLLNLPSAPCCCRSRYRKIRCRRSAGRRGDSQIPSYIGYLLHRCCSDAEKAFLLDNNIFKYTHISYNILIPRARIETILWCCEDRLLVSTLERRCQPTPKLKKLI